MERIKTTNQLFGKGEKKMVTIDQFDEKYYLGKYHDVKGSGMSAWEHFEKYGCKEGRFASADDELEKTFNATFYLMVYPDVSKSGMDPLTHYKKYGRKEGRLYRVNYEYVKIINNSPYFDREWYVRYYFDVRNSQIDPAVDYLINGITGNRNPGPYFNSKEYLLISPDVKVHHMNPLVHYEKYGKYEKRKINVCEIQPASFPEETESFEYSFSDRMKNEKHIVSVFASFSGDGFISDFVVYLLNGLKEVSDYIVMVSDNPIYKSEIEKIRGIVNKAIFFRHEEYDFGSYKRGYQWLSDQNILCEEDDLLFLNDSCFGPVNGFEDVIEKYKQADCDFWGLSLAKFPIPYIQSFFYIFKSCVYTSNVFRKFMEGIKPEISSAYVIFNYEFRFTQILQDAGFEYATYVPKEAFALDKSRLAVVPTKFTLTLLKEYNYPLIKRKVMQGSTQESTTEILKYVEETNPELHKIMAAKLECAKIGKSGKAGLTSKYNLYYRYHVKLHNSVERGDQIKIVFLVNMSSMFPGEELMNRLLKDSRFDVKLYVIPDTRFGDDEMLDRLSDTFVEVRARYQFTRLAVEVRNGKIVEFNDVIRFADIVCYPSPYDLSFSLYNPPYAVQLGIPSIHINYGFFRSKYDRKIYGMDNYNNFWKIFLETSANYEEYKEYGYCDGLNAVISGYSKMDSLHKFTKIDKVNNKKKKIIIAPHHSVSGGTNEILALSNFQKYSQLFLDLPKKYPDIDFIFRPHPVLFSILRRKNQWGPEKVDAYIESMKSYPNVEYSTEGNYIELFAASDGIIQDCGSFLVEYMYTNKPCCYMLHSQADIENKFSQLGKDCLEHCYIAYEEADIYNYMDNVIVEDNDYKKYTREQFANERIMINYPTATETIYSYLTDFLWGNKEKDAFSLYELPTHQNETLPPKNEGQKLYVKNLIKENSKLEKLYQEQCKMFNELKMAYDQIDQQVIERNNEKIQIEQKYEQLVNSASWRVTAFLRWIYYHLIGRQHNEDK